MHRRHFLQHGLLLGSGFVIATLPNWTVQATDRPKRLIVVFLRGAIDGLNVVIPYTETAYYQARPRLAIPKPGETNGGLKLSDRFALHPELKAIFPFWQQGNLAFIHACGSPDSTRSHFDAQDYMESGTPGKRNTPDGWMNRLLGTLSNRSVIQAVNVGATTPRILSGKISVATLASGKRAEARSPLDRSQVSDAFDRLYGSNAELSKVYRQGKQARQAIQQDLMAEMEQANQGAPLPNGFAQDARRLAQLMRRDPRVQMGFFALGGWDTHVNQPASLARNLRSLGQGLAELQTSLGDVYQDTVIVVLSEFGRTVRENGNLGTDHGHGNVMWLMGQGIKGGQVYGEFPGLQDNQLYEGRDLAITTDFRSAIAPILEQHLRLTDPQLAQVFPNYSPSSKVNFL
jgi:uncharacterized protein (DUF1501 family)